MKRLSILIVALLVGAAAPARAWCEAACLATAHRESAQRHCPAHEPTSDGPAIGAAGIAECPVIESARPVPVKLDLSLANITVAMRSCARATAPSPAAPSHWRSADLFERHTPLRI